MKVYCRDCKYFFNGESRAYGSYCESPGLGVIADYIFGDSKRILYVTDKDYPNKRDTNGCTFYKPNLKTKFKNYLRRGTK
jgi:hypothetical protein